MDDVTKYATKIVNGEIMGGKLLILACKRHLNDLKRQNTDDFPYFFDEKRVDGVLEFAKHVPDPDSGEPLPLMLWEKFILGSINGWRSEKTGGKRYKYANISVARGQGKTYIASIQATYDFFVQSHNKHNQDILLAANTTQQTTKLFNYTKDTVEKMLIFVFPKLRRIVRPRNYDVVDINKKNQIVRMSGESGKFDSYHAVTAIFDEAGEQKTNSSFNKITSGQIKIPEACFIRISTAYPNPNSPFRQDIQNIVEDIKKGKANTTFLAVWSQDSNEEVWKPETWEKSNPLLGLETDKESLLEGLLAERDSKVRSGELNDFIVKNMNVWLNAKKDAAFVLQDIENAAIDSFDMHDQPVYIGFDNSMTSDDAALSFVFPYEDSSGNQRWHIYQHSFIPWHKSGSIEAKENEDGINYRHSEELGFSTITPHVKGLISNDDTYDWLLTFVDEYNLDVQAFCYDWAHTSAFIKALDSNTTWNIQAVRQGTLSLNEPTKWLQDAFIEGRVTTLNDKLLQKSFVNAIVTSDNNGIKVDKNKATMKIDIVDATIDALSEAIFYFENAGGEISF